jgi:membrane associated rhomboid family serine protease
MFLFALLVVGSFAVYCLKPEERVRILQAVAGRVRQTLDTVQQHQRRRGERHDEFLDALAARTRRPYLTLTLVAYNAAMFTFMAFAPGSVGDPDTLLHWGASVGPVTANGQWWRLVTATFVHAGVISLIVDLIAFTQVALLVERMFGQVALAVIYVGAAAFSGAIGLWSEPLAITSGASGAVFGIYGLLVALVVRGTWQRSPSRVPLRVMKRLAPAALIFLGYYMAQGGPRWSAGMAAFVVAFAVGLALTRNVAERKPETPRVIWLATTPLSIAMMMVAPLSGMTDVRAEVTNLVTVDSQTSAIYMAATEQFKRGALNADSLALLIERSIVPKLEAGRARLNAIGGVPRQQRPLVDAANEYIRLRRESWAIRATALHKANMRLLRDADQKERESLDTLEKIKSGL